MTLAKPVAATPPRAIAAPAGALADEKTIGFIREVAADRRLTLYEKGLLLTTAALGGMAGWRDFPGEDAPAVCEGFERLQRLGYTEAASGYRFRIREAANG